MSGQKSLNGTGKIEFNICIPDLGDKEIKKALGDAFPEMVLNERGNLILDIREDPVNTKFLITEKLNCSVNEVLWLDGGLTVEQLTAMM